MKKAITYLAVSLCLAFGGCLHEGGLENCPGELLLSFYLDDAYAPGTYDSRIANDVQIYVFRDHRCIQAMLIPYDRISRERFCRLAKTPEMEGNIDLVAWAVPAAQPHSDIPVWTVGDRLDDQLISEQPLPQATQYYAAGPRELYRGRLSFAESFNETSAYRIGMMYTACRVEVYVTDRSETLYPGLDLLHARVSGVMSQMDMNLRGVGSPARVLSRLSCPMDDHVDFDTGRFDVLPSAAGQTVAVDIRSGGTLYATLNVPQDELPRGAWAGGLLIFRYTMGNDYFTLEVNKFRVNVYRVDLH